MVQYINTDHHVLTLNRVLVNWNLSGDVILYIIDTPMPLDISKSRAYNYTAILFFTFLYFFLLEHRSYTMRDGRIKNECTHYYLHRHIIWHNTLFYFLIEFPRIYIQFTENYTINIVKGYMIFCRVFCIEKRSHVYVI